MSSTSRGKLPKKMKAKKKAKASTSGASAAASAESSVKPKARVYVPSAAVAPSELEMDRSAYRLYHAVETHEACLTFDVIPDKLGESRDSGPFTVYMISGTQAEVAAKNALYVMRLSNMREMRQRKAGKEEGNDAEDSDSDSDSDSSSSSDSEAENEGVSTRTKPQLDLVEIAQADCVNRVRLTQLNEKPICATWSDRGRVLLYDLSEQLAALDDVNKHAEYLRDLRRDHVKPLFSFAGHRCSGFALAFSEVEQGRLATGDEKQNIHAWFPRSDGTWHVSNAAFQHNASVEDLAWSPREKDVLVSASADRSIRVWDVRLAARDACVAHVPDAHDGDVNVISWNRRETHFLVSGGDDAALRIWDLRLVKSKCEPDEAALATFKHHLGPITSVEWSHHDPSVFAASGEDDQVTQWDLAVEADAPNEHSVAAKNDAPDPDAAESKADGDDGEKDADSETPAKKKRTVKKKKKRSEEDDDELGKLPEQLLFIHQGQQEVKELHWHAQIPGLLISTSLTGFNVFRTISV